MKYAVITVAGQSTRFNEGERDKRLKAIYFEDEPKDTLLWRLVQKTEHWADCIILVGGYQYEALTDYAGRYLPGQKEKIRFVRNVEYGTLQSGYSLYLGLQEAFRGKDASEILFLEGDLGVDAPSLQRVMDAGHSVLTVNREPIHADRAVVLYQDGNGRYHYVFNAEHGLLRIDEPFSAVFHSGQVWKFDDVKLLEECCGAFADTDRSGTNLEIIQSYLDGLGGRKVEMIIFERWLNCNTRADYRRAVHHWRAS